MVRRLLPLLSWAATAAAGGTPFSHSLCKQRLHTHGQAQRQRGLALCGPATWLRAEGITKALHRSRCATLLHRQSRTSAPQAQPPEGGARARGPAAAAAAAEDGAPGCCPPNWISGERARHCCRCCHCCCRCCWCGRHQRTVHRRHRSTATQLLPAAGTACPCWVKRVKRRRMHHRRHHVPTTAAQLPRPPLQQQLLHCRC
mmetsp:Transcript_37636/g.95066  ORF Transcript_37636/g.95066 Transcript_37636/m.95066 type:complete len:201 (+) Transcript_37636:685-1287(+)